MPAAIRSAMPGKGWFSRLNWYRVALISFVGMVALPTLLTLAYYALVAAPQYQASVRLAVYAVGRDASDAAAEFDGVQGKTDAKDKSKKDGLLGEDAPRAGGAKQIASKAIKLMSSVFGNKSDGKDPFIVVNYIRSRTIIADLDKDGWLTRVLASDKADFLARLPDDASREALWRKFNTRVDAQVDTVSRLITVNVRAFTPEEASELAKRIVAASETLVNDVRGRTLKDATAAAEETLARAETRYLDALSGVRQLRDEAGVIDPAEGAMALAKALTQLKVIKATLEMQYAGLTATLSADAPTVRALRARIDATDAEIVSLQKELTGMEDDAGKVAAYIADFETRETERMLAQTAYEQAVTSFDRAQSDADRQSVFLAVFEPPGLPEESRFPRGWRIAGTVFIALAAIWSVLSLIGAGVRDQMRLK